jgi:O-antigen ligase
MGQGILAFILFFLPIVFCPLIYHTYELTKTVFFRLFTELLVVMSWPAIFSELSFFLKDKKKNLISLLVLGYFFWVFLTSLLGFFWPRSLLGNYYRQQGLFTFFHFIFFFLLVVLFVGRLKKEWLAFSLSGGAFLGGLMKSSGHPNFLAGYLVITLPFTFYLIKKRKIFSIFLFFQVWAVIQSGSRMAVFLLFAVLGFYFLRCLKKERFLLLFFLILILLSLPFAREVSFYENRWRIWQKGWLAFGQRPIFGWGLENFEYAFGSVLKPEKDIGLTDIRVDKAHNEFLEIAVSSGIVGLGLYLAIIFSSLKLFWQKLKSSENKDWWLAVFLSLIVFVIRSQFNPISIAEYVLFWFLIGLAAVNKIPKEEILEKRILGLMVVFSLLLMAIFNLRSLMADYYFKKGLFQKARQIFPWEEVYQLKVKGYN